MHNIIVTSSERYEYECKILVLKSLIVHKWMYVRIIIRNRGHHNIDQIKSNQSINQSISAHVYTRALVMCQLSLLAVYMNTQTRARKHTHTYFSDTHTCAVRHTHTYFSDTHTCTYHKHVHAYPSYTHTCTARTCPPCRCTRTCKLCVGCISQGAEAEQPHSFKQYGDREGEKEGEGEKEDVLLERKKCRL